MMDKRQKLAGVKVMEDRCGIKVINVCDLIDVLFGSNWAADYVAGKFTYADQKRSIKSWCLDNGAHYYSRGRENFSLYEATREAVENKCSVVVVEDLS